MLYATEPTLRKFDVTNGLSQNRVNVIYEDKYGLIWIGTNDGLNRFEDGQLKMFYSNKNDKYSLKSDKIFAMQEDNQDRLWLGTYGAGLIYYDYNTNRFIAPPISYKKYQNLVMSIAIDTARNLIWATTQGGGFFRYDYLTGRKRDYIRETDDKISSNEFIGISIIDDKIYAGNSMGELIELDSNFKITNVYKVANSAIIGVHPYQSKLFVTTMSDKYFIYDTDNKASISSIVENVDITSLFVVTAVSQTSDTEFTIATQSGAQYLKLVGDTIYVEKIIGQSLSEEDGEPFLCTLLDSRGTEWFGTNGYGVYYKNKYFDLFTTTKRGHSEKDLTFESVRAIHKFGNELWVGGYGGINLINLKTKKVSAVPYVMIPDRATIPTTWSDHMYNNNIYNFYQDKLNSDWIWVGTEGYGLYQYSKKLKKIKYVRLYLENDYSAEVSSVFSMDEYDGNLLLGSSEGIYAYEPKSGVQTLLSTINRALSRKRIDVKSFFVDGSDIYMVVNAIGAFIYNIEQAKCTSIADYFPKLDSTIFVNANSIQKFRDGVLLSTKEDGLFILNLKNRTYKQYNYTNGLINNCAYEVLIEDNNNLWVSTNRGISRIDISSNIITNFNNNVFGLIGEYNLNAAYRESDSSFYFGGIGGIVSFNPKSLSDMRLKSRLIIKSVELNHGNKIDNFYFVENDTIKVDYLDDLVEINFITNEYLLATNLKYQYRLNSKNWHTARNNKINLTGLQTGENRIDIRVFDEQGQVSQETHFYIDVSVPFWATNWFLVLCGAIFIYIIYYVYSRNIKKLKSKLLVFGRENRALKSHNISLSKNFELLSANTSNVVWQTDTNFNILYLSPNLFDYYNINNYGINLNLSDIYISDDLAQLREEIIHLKLFQHKFERKLFHKNSSITEKKFSDVKIKILIDAMGELTGLIGVVSDTKEKEKAMLQLQEKEELFSTLVSTILEPMLITSWEGEILFANNEAKSVLDIHQSDLYDKTLFDFTEDPLNSELRKQVYIVKTGDSFNKQQFTLIVNDKAKTVEASGVQIVYYQRNVFLFTFRDVTERINLINELTISKIEAESSSEIKTMYLSNLAHELKTPINSISGFSDILQSKISDPILSSYLDSIKESSRLLLQLINDLLYYTKAESGKLEMRPVPTSVNKLVSELENIFKIDIQQKNLEFVKNINTNGIEHLLNIDQLKLKQIILNLLNNAVKHTDTGQVTLSISIDNLNKSQVDLQIAVEDTGKGIPKERLKEIFKAFKQVNFSDESNGFGLGLAIVNRILDSMNGEIKVESEFGKGSKFIVTIRNINLVLKNTPLSAKSAEFDFVDKFIRRDNNLHYYSLETLQSVIVEMEGELSRKLSKIKKNFLLNDIAAFAEQVNGIATERGVEFLTNYSNELISATKTIEVEKINYLLENFYNLVELIRQLIEKRYGKEQRKNINSR